MRSSSIRAVVKLDSVNPETLSGLLYRRGDAVHEHVLTALSRIDEFEALVGVWTGKGTEVVRNRASIAVVPVCDTGEGLSRTHVHRMNAAGHLGRCHMDIST